MKVRDKQTNEITCASYAHNRLGNLRMWVNGKFYSDKDFGKRFVQIDKEPICVQTGITCGFPCYDKCPRYDEK